ncbi:MAG: hypothetical protein R3224_00635 [Balneolaceae bacterium]|nr:hypothetical protein [Balneolaceae bacterium]
MKYIAALDYDHLDNGVFLTSIGRSLAEQQGVRAFIIHGESEYTERLIQTGIMRDEARVRCIKDLNHRLVALFADQGVSTIGLNGYHKNAIRLEDGELQLDRDFFSSLPKQPVLLLSTLVLDTESQQPVPVELAGFLEFISDRLYPDEVFLFSKDSDTYIPQSKTMIPDDLEGIDIDARLTTAAAFANLPVLDGSVKLDDLS